LIWIKHDRAAGLFSCLETNASGSHDDEMEHTTPTVPADAAQEPPQDESVSAPSNIVVFLHAVGILRAAALERLLLARVAAGKDIDMVMRRTRAPEAETAPAEPQP
jgi:hypothetical protein